MQTYGTYIMRSGSTERKWPAARWLRVRAAAAYLGVGVGTLNKLRTVRRRPAILEDDGGRCSVCTGPRI